MKNYYLLLIGKAISIFGDKLNNIAIMWLVYHTSDSFFLSLISLVVSYLPNVLFSTHIGFLADKHSPKKLLVISDIANGVLAITLSLIVFKFDSVNVAVILFIAFLMAIFDCIYGIASNATIKYIVEENELLEANAKMFMVTRLFSILGTSMGSVLYVLVAPYILFFINGITFILSAISEIFIKIDFVSHIKEKIKFNISKDLIQPFHLAKKYKVVFFFTITGGTIINFFLAPLSLYLMAFINNFFNLEVMFMALRWL